MLCLLEKGHWPQTENHKTEPSGQKSQNKAHLTHAPTETLLVPARNRRNGRTAAFAKREFF